MIYEDRSYPSIMGTDLNQVMAQKVLRSKTRQCPYFTKYILESSKRVARIPGRGSSYEYARTRGESTLVACSRVSAHRVILYVVVWRDARSMMSKFSFVCFGLVLKNHPLARTDAWWVTVTGQIELSPQPWKCFLYP